MPFFFYFLLFVLIKPCNVKVLLTCQGSVLRQKPGRFAPCPVLPASCKLQVPPHSRRITPPISPGIVPTTNVRSVVVKEAQLGRDPLSLTATHVINSLSCNQSRDLTTSTADGGPAGKQGAMPWASAPHRVHAAGERGATTIGEPRTLDWTSCGYTSGWSPNVVHD